MSGAALRRVSAVFFNLAGAHTNDALETIERDVAPILAKHRIGDLSERGALPPRRRAEGARGDARPLGRTGARARALHLAFVRQGAALDAGEEEAARRDHRAARGARHAVRTERARRRARLHAGARRRGGSRRPARCAARGRGQGGGRARHGRASTSITLSRSSIEPFLQFSSRRDLREAAFKAWIARGENGGATDNRAIIAEMVQLRAERAQAARLRELRAFPPRRHDGEDAGGGARPARLGLARRRARRRCAKATRCRR